MVKVVSYNKGWAVRFLELQYVLSDALRDIQVVSVEQAGRTSVQGLAAKPIIDIEVKLRRPKAIASACRLAAAAHEDIDHDRDDQHNRGCHQLNRRRQAEQRHAVDDRGDDTTYLPRYPAKVVAWICSWTRLFWWSKQAVQPASVKKSGGGSR